MPWFDHVTPDAIGHALILGMSLLALIIVALAMVRGAWRARPRKAGPKDVAPFATGRSIAPPPKPADPLSRSKSPAPTQVDDPRRTAAFEYDRIVRYIERSSEKVQNVHVANRAAARHIDNAEMALNRLLADVAPFMTQRLIPTVIPRQSLT